MKIYLTSCWLLLLLVFSCQSPTSYKGKSGKADKYTAQKTNIAEKESGYTKDQLHINPFKNEHGWGYDIKVEGEVLIHQPSIPAKEGLTGFASKAKAKRAAKLVTHKMSCGIMPPSVTKEELDSLNVLK
jgi:hypothetical protein